MARPKVPKELQKKRRREYMRMYRQRRKEQSFAEILKRSPAPSTPSPEGVTTTNNYLCTMEGE